MTAPLGLLGAMAMVALVEAVVAGHALDVTPTVTYSWTLSGIAAGDEAPGRQVLACGDSLIKHAFQPRVINARLGLSAFNLAAPAAPAPATYVLLRRALEAGATPEAVFVDFAPDILAGGPETALRNWPELLTIGEWLELAWCYGDLDFLARSAVDRLLPTARARFEVRAGVLAALAGSTASPREVTLDHQHHWQTNGGAHLAPKNPVFTGVITDEEHRRLMSGGFWCHRINAAYLEKLCALTAAHGIPVYWLLAPVAPALQERRTATGAEERHTRLVRSFADRFPHVTVLDARFSGYGPDLFVDARHLDRDGAATLSVDMAEVLRRRRSGIPTPGWVVLPPYRPVPDGPPLEDIRQSTLARQDAPAP